MRGRPLSLEHTLNFETIHTPKHKLYHVLKPLEFAAVDLFKKNIRADLKVYTSRLSDIQVCGTQTFQPHPTAQSLHSGSYLRFAFELCMYMNNSHQCAFSLQATPEITSSWCHTSSITELLLETVAMFQLVPSALHTVAW